MKTDNGSPVATHEPLNESRVYLALRLVDTTTRLNEIQNSEIVHPLKLLVKLCERIDRLERGLKSRFIEMEIDLAWDTCPFTIPLIWGD